MMYFGGRLILLAIGTIGALSVILGVLWTLFSFSSGSRNASSESESAEEVLERSLAEGEIEVDEYNKQLADLSKTKRAG